MDERDDIKATLPYVGGLRTDTDDSMPEIGTVLAGKYRVERVIGVGGMGVVAAAYHLQLGRPVAIKYLVADALDYPDIVERFTREAQVAARIQSEHVAHVIDIGAGDSGRPYSDLVYMDGIDLASLVEAQGPLAVVDVVRYVLEACEALAEAHAASVVHRDLKPANLFLAKQPDRRRIVKVLDFGVSKIMGESMTTPSAVLGTIMYMSPEQLESSRHVDLRTDIWALGVILYELLAGEPPFTGVTIVSVAEAVKDNRPRPLRQLRPEVPEELDAVIMRCLRTAPDERHATVLELAIALAPFATKRDRQSVRTISGVLRGSVPPPPLGGDTLDPSEPVAAFGARDRPLTDARELALRSDRSLPTTLDAPGPLGPSGVVPPLPSDAPTIVSTSPSPSPPASMLKRSSSSSASSLVPWPVWLVGVAVVAALIVIGRAGPRLVARPSPPPPEPVVLDVADAARDAGATAPGESSPGPRR